MNPRDEIIQRNKIRSLELYLDTADRESKRLRAELDLADELHFDEVLVLYMALWVATS